MSTNEQQKMLNKANPEIGFTLVSGSMSFLTRKLYNSLVFHAQRQGTAGKGKLPLAVEWDVAAVGIDTNQYFWVPLKDLSDDAAAGNDYSGVRKWLLKMMDVKVRRGVAGAWEQYSHILGEVTLLNTVAQTPGARQGKWIVGWYFPPGLESLLLNPAQFTPISLYYQSLLSTEAALVLYEIGRRYAGWEQHKTKEMSWQDWQSVLIANGSPRQEYKLFKRDFLKPALAQINQVTDITIDVIEVRAAGSKAVAKLWFYVELKRQAGLGYPPPPAINTRLLERLEAIGISADEAERRLSEYTEERILEALAWVENRARKTELSPVENKAGLLISALKDDYAGKEKKQGEVKNKAQAKAAAEQRLKNEKEGAEAAQRQEQRRAALEQFATLPAVEQGRWFADYKSQQPPQLRKSADEYLVPGTKLDSRKAITRAFGVWLADRMSGRPNETEAQ